MNYESFEFLRVTVDDRIATVVLDRPEHMNAVNGQLHGELARVFRDLQADHEVDVVVLTGAGHAFSAGGDIPWFQEAVDEPGRFEQTVREGKEIIFSLLDCEKIIIAKVNGHAVGLGATLALFCDVIFAADTAKIGDPHVGVGLVAGDGGAVIWPQLIGYARAKEYLITGDLLSAGEAERIGLINHSVPAESLDEAVEQFAARIRHGATKAIRWSKVATNIGLKQLAHSIMDTSMAYEALSVRTDDHAEAVAAFRDRRTPKFTGQ